MANIVKLFEKRIFILKNKFAGLKKSFIFAHSKNNGPFVYRLGRQVFILVRGVRFPYGLQFKKLRKTKWQIISQH